jgi:hypothetical protein
VWEAVRVRDTVHTISILQRSGLILILNGYVVRVHVSTRYHL